MKKIVVFTGAGISAESGIKTFRDSDGLWEGHAIEDVATPNAFKKNPSLVLDFYNQRRKNCLEAIPNDAHRYIVALEKNFEVTVITQNVDDLHERAGSTNVIHLHGELLKMCSSTNKELVYDINKDIAIGDYAEDGTQLRPFIVWFHEEVPLMDVAIAIASKADIFIVIGSSLVVYPAASLLQFVPNSATVYIIDKKIPSISLRNNYVAIENIASEGMKKLCNLLLPN